MWKDSKEWLLRSTYYLVLLIVEISMSCNIAMTQIIALLIQ